MLEKNILTTLAYYQALGNMPLTLTELQKYLVKKEGKNNVPLFEIQKALDFLVNSKIVYVKNGFFYLENNNFYSKRIENIKITQKKWKELVYMAKFLIYIPYIRSVAVTGSLALNNSSTGSDFDIFIETKKDRIWMSRLLVTLTTWILGRKKYKKRRKDRLCFNRFVVENSDLGPTNINQIVNNRVILWRHKQDTKYESIFFFKSNPINILFKNLTEHILDVTGLGLLTEKITGWLQIQKINHNSVKYPKYIFPLQVKVSNIFFYYPRVLEGEEKYKQILKSINQ
ncbi:MAG: hypothetical protein A3H51_03165 [Candidatus Spechtbacteria bacterium RIFCSPLOWO2_02_FULL_38_8]|uniref:Polymerase nucleotidyl transferase domain-containing protein n=1 Tax=Candidatus Spechtbacteria bacterium RIFCSPLOWO2_02_FULL_38_8 TaxID=1802164 RepID=A0A1G2HIR7_9BACT|nr:MAG: hypothetical protein A3H51_03165 [Candidatus Spechtbacteria bacterium RIFCSPLOWO2_02_FULL_38_8]